MEPIPSNVYIQITDPSTSRKWIYYIHGRTRSRGHYIIENTNKGYEGQVSSVDDKWINKYRAEIISIDGTSNE